MRSSSVVTLEFPVDAPPRRCELRLPPPIATVSHSLLIFQ